MKKIMILIMFLLLSVGVSAVVLNTNGGSVFDSAVDFVRSREANRTLVNTIHRERFDYNIYETELCRTVRTTERKERFDSYSCASRKNLTTRCTSVTIPSHYRCYLPPYIAERVDKTFLNCPGGWEK